MAQPINYMAMMPQVDLGQQFAQLGQSIGDYGAAMQKRQAAQRRQQYATELQAALNDGGQVAIAGLIAKYPEQREALGDAAKILDTAQGQQEFATGMQISSALENGSPEAARPLLMARVEAAKNAGNSPGIYGQILDALDRGDITAAKGATNYALGLYGGDRYIKAVEGITKARTQPSDIKKAEAGADQARSDADVAAVKAKFAESQAAIDLQKTGWDIKKIQNDIDVSKQNARIAMMNASLSREGNDLKRQELQLKIDEALTKRDETVRAKIGEKQTAINAVNSTAGVFNDILADEDTLRAAVGASAWRGALPGTKTRAMAGKIEQLQNMMTAENLGLLKGAMSDKDIAFLRNISTNMDRYQNEESFLAEMKRVGGNLIKAQNLLADKYGAPRGGFEMPSGQTDAADIDALVKKYGGL